MREIKFRAWDKENKKLLPVLSIEFEFNKQVCLQGASNYCQHIDEVVLQQFTGLKDKNGKEIYEGDIVKGFDYYGDEHIWQVSWEILSRDTGFNIGEEDELEVIGNVFENHELLK